jgi:RNA polymerase sigma factor (sigma-70 family)
MDRTAFTLLYHEERPLLLRQLRRQFRDLDGATVEDVVHDAFDRLWRRYGDDERESGSAGPGDAAHAPDAPGAWLWRTARNAAVDHLRAASRARGRESADHTPADRVSAVATAHSVDPAHTLSHLAAPVPPDDSSDQHATRLRTMRQALAELSPRDRDVLTLFYVDGLRYAEIAERTGLRAASLGTTLLRARQRLAARLRGMLASDDPLAAARYAGVATAAPVPARHA